MKTTKITNRMKKAASDAVGRRLEPATIQDALRAFDGVPTEQIEQDLATGNGQTEAMRIVIALRGLPTQRESVYA